MFLFLPCSFKSFYLSSILHNFDIYLCSTVIYMKICRILRVFFTGRQNRRLKIICFPFSIYFAVHVERDICCCMSDEANSVFALVELFTLHLHSDALNEKFSV